MTSSMWWDISLQAIMFLIGIGTYLYMNDHPRKLLNRYHAYRNHNKHQSRLHFVKAAQLLARARAYPPSSPHFTSFAASCASEADAAITLDPTDAANHILRAIALDLQGFKPSALDAINIALSPLAAASLSEEEKADALVKRAQLRMELGTDEDDVSVWNVVESELREAVKLNKESDSAWCLLGKCCQELGNVESAREAFQEAVRIQPQSVAANQGLAQLPSA